MAEENDVNHVTEKENAKDPEVVHDLKNDNDVELIDLSDDDDNSKPEGANGDKLKDESDKKEKENGEANNERENEVENEVENVDNSNDMSNEVSNSKINSDDEIMISDDEAGEEEAIAEVNQVKTSESSTEKKVNNHVNKNDTAQDRAQEILIDSSGEDEAQDLTTKSNNASVEDVVPKLSNELIGFPSIFKDVITLGECVAISKKPRSDINVDKDYSILDCPSQVVPLIIKKTNSFPEKLKVEKDENTPKVVSPPTAPSQSTNNKNMLTISDFYSSSIGKFLIGIGLSRVKQWYHKDAINKIRKQIRKEGEAEDLMEELKKQQDYLNSCRAANSSYIFPTDKCEHCEFRTEFISVLDQHLNYPHMTTRKEYKCNYCQFSTRDSKVIISHVNLLHEKKCMIELPPQLYECPVCPYESGVKSKAATHIAKCLKFYVPDKLLVNKDDYFPTITPKPITQEDIKIYEATLQALRFAALNPQTKVPPIPGLPAGLQQMYSAQPASRGSGVGPGRPNKGPSNKTRSVNPFMMNQMNLKNVSPQLYQMLSAGPHGQLSLPSVPNMQAGNALHFINKHQQMLNKMNIASQSSVRNLQTNVANNVAVNSKPNILSKPSNYSTSRLESNPKGSFVMCEICDGYIKDLEQLRTHMHWIHKVRIHPKMLANRPPLNCQKCQWRFFTDQGLERHLLGAHGLVTSNMQDMVNQNQDGGRCTICGRVFTNKLVTHMNQVHKINLKPAHLSYKCTVCSATFNLYRLFENHVYMVHSGSVKRNASDDHSGQPQRKRTAIDGLVPGTAANGN